MNTFYSMQKKMEGVGVGSVYWAGRGVNDTFPDTNLIFSHKVYMSSTTLKIILCLTSLENTIHIHISKENNVQHLLPHFNQ